jgi:hypothetical protein
MRCKRFVQRNMPQLCHPVIVCQFCAMRGSLLSPNPMPTRECCAVCGNIAPRSMRPMQATFCELHGNRSPFSAELHHVWSYRPHSVVAGKHVRAAQPVHVVLQRHARTHLLLSDGPPMRQRRRCCTVAARFAADEGA